MSLDDLLATYSSVSPLAERRALLVAMATRLPAPEFLWYDVAMQALHGDEPELKIPALRLLAHAPRSWHQVLMVALTDGGAELQHAALEALHTHAVAEPERRDAFAALGVLPGWHAESQALWAALMAARAETITPDIEEEHTTWPTRPGDREDLPEPTSAQALELDRLTNALAAAGHEVEVLEGRVLELEEENFQLREDRTRLGLAFEDERQRANGLAFELEALRERHDALHVELLGQIEALQHDAERDTRRFQLTVTGLEAALDQAHARQRRTLAAGLLSLAVIAAVGGPIVFSLANRSAAMATSELPVRAAIHDDHGYRKAFEKVKAEAAALQGEGKLQQALVTWQVAIRLAPSAADARSAEAGAQALVVKLQALPGADASRERAPKRAAVTSQQALKDAEHNAPQAVAARRQAPVALGGLAARAASKGPHWGASLHPALPSVGNGDLIPARVRAKF